jgi:hypothetical protein
MIPGAALVAAVSSIVAVDVAPAISASEAERLEQSCSIVFVSHGEEACTVSLDGSSEHRVLVAWKSTSGSLQVSIELERGGDRERVVRVLSFHESSSEAERWEAVGLVVAAIVSAEMVAKKTEEPPEPPPPVIKPPPEEDGVGVTLEFGGAVRQEAAPEFLSGGGVMRMSFDLGSRFQPTFALGGFAGTTPVNQLSISAGSRHSLVNE